MNTEITYLLCVDIGNSNITVALCHDQQVEARYRMKTKARRSSDELVGEFQKFLRAANVQTDQVEGIIICSVVPKLMHSMRAAMIKLFNKEPMVLTDRLDSGITNLLENPKSVGHDRIADSVGASYIYGTPVLVADFGTATTYDFIDSQKQLIAGAISVGIESGAQALWSQTAQLPEIELDAPETIMATSTSTEMQAGIFYQFLGGFEKTVEAYQKAAGYPFKVVVTGGLGRIIAPYSSLIDAYDPNLLFKGLALIYERNK